VFPRFQLAFLTPHARRLLSNTPEETVTLFLSSSLFTHLHFPSTCPVSLARPGERALSPISQWAHLTSLLDFDFSSYFCSPPQSRSLIFFRTDQFSFSKSCPLIHENGPSMAIHRFSFFADTNTSPLVFPPFPLFQNLLFCLAPLISSLLPSLRLTYIPPRAKEIFSFMSWCFRRARFAPLPLPSPPMLRRPRLFRLLQEVTLISRPLPVDFPGYTTQTQSLFFPFALPLFNS